VNHNRALKEQSQQPEVVLQQLQSACNNRNLIKEMQAEAVGVEGGVGSSGVPGIQPPAGRVVGREHKTDGLQFTKEFSGKCVTYRVEMRDVLSRAHGDDSAGGPIPGGAYPLVVGDVPYGAEDMDVRWGGADFEALFRNINQANTRDVFVILLFLDEGQIHEATVAFNTVWDGKDGGNAGHETIGWVQEGVKNSGGVRLNQTFEFIKMFYVNRERNGRLKEHYHGPDDNRDKHVVFDNVTKFFLSPITGQALNLHQKPVSLMVHLIKLFSPLECKVLDVCAGSGTYLFLICIISSRSVACIICFCWSRGSHIICI
jgi:hypothetical protein